MTSTLFITFLSFSLLVIFSGILIFFTKDKILQGLGFVVGSAVFVVLFATFTTLNIAFVAMIILILTYVFSMKRDYHDSNN
ncbi:MAG: hypothetical protein PHS99_02065 [Candidatus Marinimicrobia bacterium]|nr:hypothetical protein [Candidatus Neomarinimicrobiota bacterium]